MTSGTVSAHAYRFRRADADYFVKEIKDNERRIHRLLIAFDLDIAPRVRYPELLADHILVCDYVEGAAMTGKRLDRGLIARYAEMQNALNRRPVLEAHNAFSGCTFNDHDDGFYRASIERCLDEGYQNLLLLRAHRLPIVEVFVEIADCVRAQREAVVDAFAGMPFAWLHHDFREAHILGCPPKLVDWGSSYGHGPFLFDLAPFFAGDAAGLADFGAHSEVCAGAAGGEIARWLYAANCASLGGLLLWRLSDLSYVDGRQGRAACRDLLQYEYPAYASLLDGLPPKRSDDA